MQQLDPIQVREAEILRIAESKRDLAALKQHLIDVINSKEFKASHRSGQFLKYIVEQALAGHFDSLKERVIGIELFGRTSSYETSEDAIVRVTASDVRKRLLQHYGGLQSPSEFRITLPLGSYIPEITRRSNSPVDPPNTIGIQELQVNATEAPAEPLPVPHRGRQRIRWLSLGLILVALNLAVWALLFRSSSHSAAPQIHVLPWSVFLTSSHSLQLITSDPNIAEIQTITGSQISVSDYSNHNYIPEPNKLTPEALAFTRKFLRGDKTSLPDTPIAVGIAELAQAYSTKIDVHAARNIQLSDLKTEDNFIFLGSPRSDPWSSFYSDQLDFRFIYDKDSDKEIIRNFHPRSNEQPYYIPTAQGRATGESYSIIAFVRNPDQNGHVLLLAGLNSEGTAAAGKLAIDLPRLMTTLQKCGIQPSDSIQNFELLLHLTTMAGSPNNIEVVACHILAANPTQEH